VIAFDARAAKALASGNHLTFASAAGLRLKATASTRTWLYRYKSPVDDRMRQVRLGHWPTMSPTAALVAWQQAREARASGADIASRRREDKSDERDRVEQARRAKALGDYTVRHLADDYLSIHLLAPTCHDDRRAAPRLDSRQQRTCRLGRAASRAGFTPCATPPTARLHRSSPASPMVAPAVSAQCPCTWPISRDSYRRNRHSATTPRHPSLPRGFLPRGLSDTRPQATAGRGTASRTGGCPTTLNSCRRPICTGERPVSARLQTLTKSRLSVPSWPKV